MAYGELGRYRVIKDIELRMINFWCKIVNGSEHKLSHMVYRFLRILHDNNLYKSPWIVKVKSVLDRAGMSYVWNPPEQQFQLNRPFIPKDWLSKTLNLRLSDIYQHDWLADVNSNSQCKVYRMFKRKLAFEKYLVILNNSHRINFCKFRCCNYCISTITGRQQGIAFQDRICNLCDNNKLGDEFHFIFECPAFSVDRKSKFKSYFRKRPNSLKLQQLFEINNKSQLIKLSKLSTSTH